jgi:nucleotide-binding universal stress UspA family protein
MRLVVGYDASESSRRALRWAIERAGPDGHVLAVHAYEPPPEWEGTPYWNQSVIDHQAYGRKILEEIASPGPPEVEPDLIEGPAASAILRAAEAHRADEIAMGSHGHSRIVAAVGGVALGVLSRADRPVMIIPRARET